ncbi:galactosyl transferase GMA12/MNN10 family-domain-containing protein [Lipomyces japonicus]|uniref:galactosyl transferase GMA12/MNN10 family-domain-containing protein n=1 Tax=Lipomyces japonicus TaxID=56871 RepID=UPI0034CD9132
MALRRIQVLAILVFLAVAGLIYASIPARLDNDLKVGGVTAAGPQSQPPKFKIDEFGLINGKKDDKKDKSTDGKKSKESEKETTKPKENKPEEDVSTDVFHDIRNKAGDTVEPKGSKVVLLTATDGKGHNGAIKGLIDKVTENRQEYCAYHGYTYQYINISKFGLTDRPPVWGKIPAIAEAFEKNKDAEWVWWLDTDAIIMTPQIDLAKHVLNPEFMKKRIAYDQQIRLPNGKPSGLKVAKDLDVSKVDIVIGQDQNGINAGSILFRRSEWTSSFLDMWQDPFYVGRRFERLEQDAMNHIIVNHPRMREHVAIVPQRVINAFSVGGDNMGWMTGDLVVHFAGCWVDNECNSRFQDFWKRRVTVGKAIEDKQSKLLEDEKAKVIAAVKTCRAN